MRLNVENLLNLEETIAYGIFKGLTYPWEALSKISDHILAVGKGLSEDDYIKRGDNIWISKSAKIAPSAYLEGPLIIDHGTEVRHCAYIRGKAIVGQNCVVGNSTELKNVILFNGVQAGHYNYVGDSILGYKAHMGAGSITSNLKSDNSNIVVHNGDEAIETGLRKFGTILGDHVEVGCNAVLNPGSVVGRHSNIYPLSMVRGVVASNIIYKKQGDLVEKI